MRAGKSTTPLATPWRFAAGNALAKAYLGIANVDRLTTKSFKNADINMSTHVLTYAASVSLFKRIRASFEISSPAIIAFILRKKCVAIYQALFPIKNSWKL